ncbi:MAG: DUF2867 domain-containing protein [Minwuia sp.]|nr:DUF2867 domain-containing protein [Minwuia sp.]
MNRRPDVTATPLPAQSLLHQRAAPADFLDCYAVASDLAPRQAAEIITSFPGWVQFLMRLRGMLTAPFGLASEGPRTRDSIGIFPVETESAEEIIAGFNDRHLNFRVSVQSREGRVFLATWVHPHNLGGRLYLRAIMPFHILISRNALARVATRSAAT